MTKNDITKELQSIHVLLVASHGDDLSLIRHKFEELECGVTDYMDVAEQALSVCKKPLSDRQLGSL